ncbi:MAG: shikimate dehydrogenase [Candidatus Ranarchaeia archaeon]
MNSWIKPTTEIVCLFGNPVSHSLSPKMHNQMFKELGLDLVYIAHKVENIKKAIQSARDLQYRGFNITVPYKTQAIDSFDILDPLAKRAGAVNTGYWKDNQLHGTNTDILGIIDLLSKYKEQIIEDDILLVGAGGAARGVIVGIEEIQHKKTIYIANRTKSKITDLIFQFPHLEIKPISFEQIGGFIPRVKLIINATSLGRDDNISWLKTTRITDSHILFDLNYKKGGTKLVNEINKITSKIIDGFDLLIAQGKFSFKLWTGIEPSTESMKNILEEDRND